jgi:hypothetical protein
MFTLEHSHCREDGPSIIFFGKTRKRNAPKVPNDVPLDGVLANVVLGSLQRAHLVRGSEIMKGKKAHPEAREDSITGLNSTSDLGGRLPHHLRKVGRLRVVGVVFSYNQVSPR